MSGRDSVLSLICGYPARIRRMLRLGMFVSYIDESGKGERVFVVCGLTAKADPGWLSLADAWDVVLGTPPRLPFFHLADKQGLSDAEHQRKIGAFIGLINDHVERADLLVTDVRAYEAFFRARIGVTFDNPFHHGYMAVIGQCALELPDPSSVVDFVFDEMDDTQYLEIIHGYRLFKQSCPDPAVAARLGAEPVRRDDEKTPPLQAADLLAGLMRRAYLGDDEAAKSIKALEIKNWCFEWSGKKLNELFSWTQQRTPALASGSLYEDRKQRSKRLAPLRSSLKPSRNKKP